MGLAVDEKAIRNKYLKKTSRPFRETVFLPESLRIHPVTGRHCAEIGTCHRQLPKRVARRDLCAWIYVGPPARLWMRLLRIDPDRPSGSDPCGTALELSTLALPLSSFSHHHLLRCQVCIQDRMSSPVRYCPKIQGSDRTGVRSWLAMPQRAVPEIDRPASFLPVAS